MLTQLGDWSEFLHDLDYFGIKQWGSPCASSAWFGRSGQSGEAEKMIQTRVVLLSNAILSPTTRL